MAQASEDFPVALTDADMIWWCLSKYIQTSLICNGNGQPFGKNVMSTAKSLTYRNNPA